MTRRAVLRYLSHPQVLIDPAVPVPDWGLNDVGTARVAALADAVAKGALAGTISVFTSRERKARDTALPLAAALGCDCTVIDESYENDRSATGYLPGAEFEKMADAFFADPEVSTRGWERAVDAQARITACLLRIADMAPQGDVLVVGHGAVGTLLYCAQAGLPISRDHDQGPGGGGNVITYARATLVPDSGWRPMESLFNSGD
ncbi:histidine phosphatase family protein [Tateyamaria armeniaca]|uniref:Histidine phosphatase family protein n=1 Tax=Tateyamaria armeniaca TaxID=2518930 RepID=A0ABW8UZ28_9RHOB